MRFKQYINETGFKKYPKGWNRSSVRKFAKTISKNMGKDVDEKGWFDACVRKMEPEMGEGAKGFCASVKDEYFGQTKWRSGDKTVKPGKVSKNEDISIVKKTFKDKIHNIKDPSQLKEFYNNFDWNEYSDEEKDWIESNIKKVARKIECDPEQYRKK